MAERVEGAAHAVKTPIGNLPTPEDIDTHGLDVSKENLGKLLTVDKAHALSDCKQYRTHLEQFGDKCPKELFAVLAEMEKALQA